MALKPILAGGLVNVPAAGTGGSSPNFSGRKLIYVSKGTAATDTRGSNSVYSADVPFATLAAAKEAASSGDTIIVEPGTYNENNLLKNGVNWHFVFGAQVIYDGAGTEAIFDDNAATVVSTISGQGKFICADQDNASVVHLADPDSALNIECDTAESTLTPAVDNQPVVQLEDGSLEMCARLIQSAANRALNLGGSGRSVITANTIRSIGNQVVNVNSTATSTFNVKIRAGIIKGDGAGEAVMNDAGNIEAKLWVTADEISSGSSAIYVLGGKTYIVCKKAYGTGTTGIVVYWDNSGGGSQLWFTGQKITVPSAAGTQAMFGGSSSKAWVSVDEIECLGTTGNVIEMSNGTHHIHIGDWIGTANSKGVLINQGTTYLSGRVSTLLNSSSNPITIEAENEGVLVLDGATLIAEGTRDSITAADAQNVKVYSAVANKAKNGNVTIQVGTLTVDSNVS